MSSLDSSKTNGLITKIWGPHFWEVIHFVSFGYPLEPTEQQRKDYKDFYISVKNVLPCKYCRASYQDFFVEKPLIKNLGNRRDICKWLYDIHNKVNHKLGVPKCEIPSFDQVYNRYESYRAACTKTSEKERIKNTWNNKEYYREVIYLDDPKEGLSKGADGIPFYVNKKRNYFLQNNE